MESLFQRILGHWEHVYVHDKPVHVRLYSVYTQCIIYSSITCGRNASHACTRTMYLWVRIYDVTSAYVWPGSSVGMWMGMMCDIRTHSVVLGTKAVLNYTITTGYLTGSQTSADCKTTRFIIFLTSSCTPELITFMTRLNSLLVVCYWIHDLGVWYLSLEVVV